MRFQDLRGTRIRGEKRAVSDRATVQMDLSISGLNKGLGLLERAAGQGEIARLGWNLLREDLSLPSAVLYADRLRHNLDWMPR